MGVAKGRAGGEVEEVSKFVGHAVARGGLHGTRTLCISAGRHCP